MIEREEMSRGADVCRFVTTNVMQFCDWEAFYAGHDVLGPPVVQWEWGKQIEGSPFENLDAGCFLLTTWRLNTWVQPEATFRANFS